MVFGKGLDGRSESKDLFVSFRGRGRSERTGRDDRVQAGVGSPHQLPDGDLSLRVSRFDPKMVTHVCGGDSGQNPAKPREVGRRIAAVFFLASPGFGDRLLDQVGRVDPGSHRARDGLPSQHRQIRTVSFERFRLRIIVGNGASVLVQGVRPAFDVVLKLLRWNHNATQMGPPSTTVIGIVTNMPRHNRNRSDGTATRVGLDTIQLKHS